MLALAGLGLSLVTLTIFVLPAILEGRSPIAVALAGSSVIAAAALYLAHGVNERTTVAVLGTLASLALTGALAVLFVGLTELTSLMAEAELRLPRAVADARDQDYSWAEIADLLGVTRASAWQHYARHTPANRTPLDPD